MSDLSDYVDVRAIHPDYYERECWNCGYSELRKRPFTCCPECFMGQKKHDYDTESRTEEGYTDYRILWYGDIPLEEAHERYEEGTKDVRESMERRRARERQVRL